MTITLPCRWLALLALVVSLPCERGCNYGKSTSTPQKAETPQQPDVPSVIVYTVSMAKTDGFLDKTADALLGEFPDLRVTMDLKTAQFQLWAPQTVSAKVEARLAVLVAEHAKLAEENAELVLHLTVYPLDGARSGINFRRFSTTVPWCESAHRPALKVAGGDRKPQNASSREGETRQAEETECTGGRCLLMEADC